MANLIIWRHAQANMYSESRADCDRALTEQGKQDAIKMAYWLNEHLPANTEVLCSPALRCKQTVAALQALNSIKVQEVDFLSVDSTPELMASKLINNQINQTLLIIGHQPNLGELISKMLGKNQDATQVNTGAVWWLRQRINEGAIQTYLYLVKEPD